MLDDGKKPGRHVTVLFIFDTEFQYKTVRYGVFYTVVVWYQMIR